MHDETLHYRSSRYWHAIVSDYAPGYGLLLQINRYISE